MLRFLPHKIPARRIRLPVKKALLVGINYVGTSAELRGTINDVNDIRSFLSSKCGYSTFEMQTDNTPVKPTRANILQGLHRLVAGSIAGDSLFFHYSGHGTQVHDRNGDEVSGLDSAIVPLDYKQSGTIIDDQLRAIFNRAPIGVRIFCIVDACHSGSAFDLRYQYTDTSIPHPTQTQANAVYNSNMWTLRQTTTEFKQYPRTPANIIMVSGCLDSQYAADTYENDKFCGAMTWVFLESLKVSTTIKCKHLLKDMNARLRMSGYTQRPQLSCGNAFNGDTILNF